MPTNREKILQDLNEVCENIRELSQQMNLAIFKFAESIDDSLRSMIEKRLYAQEKNLERAKICEIEAVPSEKKGVNGSYFAYYYLPNLMAVVKPVHEENPELLRDMWVDDQYGALARREVLIYQIARTLGYKIIPVTILKKIQTLSTDKGIASVQRFIKFKPEVRRFSRLSLEQAAIVDVICKQFDRKYSNIGVDQDTGDLVLFDNGASFSPRANIIKKLRTLEHATHEHAKKTELDPVTLQFYPERAPKTPISDTAKKNLDYFFSEQSDEIGKLLQQMFNILLGKHAQEEYKIFINKLEQIRESGLPAYKYTSKEAIEKYKKKYNSTKK